MIFKDVPWESKKYRDWVKTLPCVVTGRKADDPHHPIACGLGGGTSTKVDDFLCIPLTREQHNELHRDPAAWEAKNGSQLYYAVKTLREARKQGVFP